MVGLLEGVVEDLETHIALRDAFLTLMGVKPTPPRGSILDEDGWPKRWSDPSYLGDGPWGA